MSACGKAGLAKKGVRGPVGGARCSELFNLSQRWRRLPTATESCTIAGGGVLAVVNQRSPPVIG